MNNWLKLNELSDIFVFPILEEVKNNYNLLNT